MHRARRVRAVQRFKCARSPTQCAHSATALPSMHLLQQMFQDRTLGRARQGLKTKGVCVRMSASDVQTQDSCPGLPPTRRATAVESIPPP